MREKGLQFGYHLVSLVGFSRLTDLRSIKDHHFGTDAL